jgi:outer membrane protein assembly factor BamE (lipoprotein component of BamABCDE complex)
MKKRVVCLCIASSLMLAGCVGYGNERLKQETEWSVRSKIQENVTTKDQIRVIFGSPNEASFTDSGKEIWKYSYETLSKDAVEFIPIVNSFGTSASGTKKELVILFQGEKVMKYSISESPHSVKTGIFR